MPELLDKLEQAKAEVARLEQAMLSATCREAGHDWKFIGGCNAGCSPDCGCSVDVHQCSRCGDCDYGDAPKADEIRANCAALHAEDGDRQGDEG